MLIEIKNWETKEVIFSYDCEDNTVKKTVEEAVKRGVSLSYAELCHVDLSDANLRKANFNCADLRKANLNYADVQRWMNKAEDLRLLTEILLSKHLNGKLE